MQRKTSRATLVAAALGMLLVIAWLTWLGTASAPRLSNGQSPQVDSSGLPSSGERLGLEAHETDRLAVGGATSEPRSSTPGLRGDITWRTAPPGSGPFPSGTMRVSFESSNAFNVIDVQVTSGSWGIETPTVPSNLLVHSLDLDGLQARAVPASVVVSDPGAVHLLAETGASSIVELFDRRSGRELEVARLVQPFSLDTQVGATLETYPGPPTNRTRTFDREAPVPVDVFGDSTSWFVGSPGYSWARLTTRNREASPSTVMLAPAGGLRVVPGAGSVGEGILKLWDVHAIDASIPSYSLPITEVSETLEFDGLAAGDYRAAWHATSKKGSRPCEIAESPLQIIAGSTSTLSLADLGHAPAPGLVEVAGSILVLEGDSTTRVNKVLLEPLDVACTEPMQSTVAPELLHSRENDAGLVEWKPVRVLPGEYRVVLSPLHYSVAVTIPSTSFFVVQLELPTLLEIEVEFVDKQTGEGVSLDWFSVSCASTSPDVQQTPLPFSRSLITPTGDRTRLELPPGTVRWTVSSPTHGYQHVFTEVRAAGTSKVEVDRGRVLELTATSFGAPVELPVDLWNSVRVRDAQGRVVVRTVTPLDAWTEGWSTRVAVTVEPRDAYAVELLGRESVLEFDSTQGDVTATIDVTGAW